MCWKVPARPEPENGALIPAQYPLLSEVARRALKALQNDGIVRIRGAFVEGVVKTAVRDFRRLIDQVPPDPYGHRQVGGMADSTALSSSMSLSTLTTVPLVEEVVRSYLGADALWTFWRGYRLEPMAPRTYRAFQAHIDGHAHELKAMVFLTPTEADQQCMLYWAGTHRIDWKVERSADTVFSAEFVAQLPEPIRATGEVGDIILFDTNGVHAGQRNLTAFRDTAVSNFSSSGFIYPVPKLHLDVSATLSKQEASFYRVISDGTQPSPFPRARMSPLIEPIGSTKSFSLPQTELCRFAHEDRQKRLQPTHADGTYLVGLSVNEALYRAAHGDLNLPQYLKDVHRIVSRDRAIGRVRDLFLSVPAGPVAQAEKPQSNKELARAIRAILPSLNPESEGEISDLRDLLFDLALCVEEASRRTYLLNSLALSIITIPHAINISGEAGWIPLLNSLYTAFGFALAFEAH